MASQKQEENHKGSPKILVFSSELISDPGIDMAGSTHMDYPTDVQVISVPCSSGINPHWVLHALDAGFEGVFIAADGTDCAYLPNCTDLTGKVMSKAQALIQEHGYEPERLKMAAICSVCAESFVSYMKKFHTALIEMRSEVHS